jgi:uroporphyrinogen-III decarboxylase
MAQLEPDTFVPVTFVFHPDWWYKNHGITFEEDFFFDPDTRVETDLQMRKVLDDYLEEFGLEQEEEINPRPSIGGVHLAAGYIISQMFGCNVEYNKDRAPQVHPKNISDKEADNISPVDLQENPVFKRLDNMVQKLKDRFGYVTGDINWGGVLNVALDIRGSEIFLDVNRNPERAKQIFDAVSKTIIDFLEYVKTKTGTTSISVNRAVKFVQPDLSLHSNCSVTMISPDTYEDMLLEYDKKLAKRFQPYGIHHDGDDLHIHADNYAKIPNDSFYDVGWGSDIEICREKLPDAFFNLRYNPKKMGPASPEEVKSDVKRMLNQSGDPKKTGFCCINMMDGDAPKSNLAAAVEAVKKYRDKYS